MLLNKLEPKEKEHQRKKILRLFFSQVNKLEGLDSVETRFWKWVRRLNPDNVNSEDRYKSMSYEFLDKLLGKEMFRARFLPWLDNYEAGLMTSIEDTKAKAFVKFIRQSVAVKQEIEEEHRIFLSQCVDTTSVSESSSSPVLTQQQPSVPGLYFEAKCSNTDCSLFRAKMYAHLGIEASVDYFQAVSLVRCSVCQMPIKTVINIGTFDCVSWFQGKTDAQGCVMGEKRLSLGYSTFDEIHIYQWEELTFQIQPLTEEQRAQANHIIIQAFDDPVVPKKRYKRKVEIDYEVASTASEEMPIVPVPIRLTAQRNSTQEYMKLLAGMDREIQLEALKNFSLRTEITMLRGALDSLTNDLRTLLS